MAATAQVGNVTKMNVQITYSVDGERHEVSVGSGILPSATATYQTVYDGTKALYNNTESGKVRLTNDTYYDSVLITSISALTEITE